MLDEKKAQRLTKCLTEAEVMLWALIFEGGFATEAQAQAAYDSHKSVKKAKGLVEEHLIQASMEV